MTSFPKRCISIFFVWTGLYSKLDRKKTMGSRGKINAIWWNIKINVQKLVDICGYELPTNLQNFTQKDLTEVKIFQKVLGGYFFCNTRYMCMSGMNVSGSRFSLLTQWRLSNIHVLVNISKYFSGKYCFVYIGLKPYNICAVRRIKW